MPVRVPVIIEIPDDALETLRTSTRRPASPPAPDSVTASTTTRGTRGSVEQPSEWRLVEEREGETYTWPEGPDEYVTFRIYEGTTSGGTVRLALGACDRVEVRGRDRQYVITHYITPAGAKRPIAEFLETDDYETSRELIAVIKGKADSPKMYDPTDVLPVEYERFRVETYRDRIDYSGSYQKLGVVAREDDVATMLGHTLIQAQSRFGLGPS